MTVNIKIGWKKLLDLERDNKMGKKKNYMPTVRRVGKKIILNDPIALAVINSVSKANCRKILELNMDRIEYFKQRAKKRDPKAPDVVIVLINVDDVHGGPIAEALMHGYNWQEIRDRGEIPFARGLAVRHTIQKVLEQFDKEAAAKLEKSTGISVVVVDNGVAEIFPA